MRDMADKSQHSRLLALVAAACAVTLSLLVGVSPLLYFDMPKKVHEFGDAFGFMNAFVSACAFTALIVTMFWQREELKLQREELALTRRELQRTAVAQENTQRTMAEEVRSLHTSMTVNSHSQLFASNFTVLSLLLDRPVLRQFIYEGRTLSESDAEELRQQVKVLCEVFSDHFELVTLVMGNMVGEPNWPGWVEYISDVISRSPQLREHYRQTVNWVTAPVFRNIVNKGFERAGEPHPFVQNAQEVAG